MGGDSNYRGAIATLFDTAPKERRKDLYDRDKELSELLEALRFGERLIVVYGVRRIGKSSLVKVGLRESGIPYVIVDLRELYYAENVVRMQSLLSHIVDGFRRQVGWYQRLGFDLREALKRIKKIHIKDYGIEVEPTAKISLTTMLSEINWWCTRQDMRFVFVFDEAQYLRFSNTRYDGVIAWAVDNLPSITFILTGSEVGVLRDFLRIDDPEAPLFGRYRREIYVDRFSAEQSIGFLVEGFKELGIDPDVREIREAVEIFDGIVGWLTHYGYYRAVREVSHRDAIAKVFEEGSRLVLDELEKVIAPSRKRYLAILKAVAQGASSWSDIKAHVMAKTGYISDKRFTDLLKKLVRYGYLAKKDDGYGIPDPVVKHVVTYI